MSPIDINVNSVQVNAVQSQTAGSAVSVNDSVQTDTAAAKTNAETAEKQAERISIAQEDIVAVSDDGDTVQASRAGRNASTTVGELISATEDGAVTQLNADDDDDNAAAVKIADRQPEIREDADVQTKTAAQMMLEQNVARQQAQDNDAAADSDDEREITSLAGYTAQQVEQLYRDGRISRYEYDRNVEEREEREAARTGENDNSDNTQRQITAQEAFAQNMGQINAAAQNQANAQEGILEAIQSGRTDLVGDIFTQQS